MHEKVNMSCEAKLFSSFIRFTYQKLIIIVHGALQQEPVQYVTSQTPEIRFILLKQ